MIGQLMNKLERTWKRVVMG